MPCPTVPSLFAVNTASLADAAQLYAQLGIAIFPLIARSKEPGVAGGFYSATTDVRVIAHWWSQRPQANIGIATGKVNGWFVLDVDPRHHGLTSLEAMERESRKRGSPTSLRETTLWQLTGGGGLHYIFQMPDLGMRPSKNIPAYPGIDLKAQGGYIVGPPSIHPNGCVYEWQHERPPATFSSVLLDLVFGHHIRAISRPVPAVSKQISRAEIGQPYRDRESDPAYWLRVSLGKATPGTRHNYAMFLAIQLVEVVGCSFEEAEHWMCEYVARVASRPHDFYDLDDAMECLEYAWKTHAA